MTAERSKIIFYGGFLILLTTSRRLSVPPRLLPPCPAGTPPKIGGELRKLGSFLGIKLPYLVKEGQGWFVLNAKEWLLVVLVTS